MAASDEILNAGNGIGSAFSDVAAAAKKQKVPNESLQRALKDFNRALKSTGSAFMDTSDGFTKFNNSVDSVERLVSKSAANLFKGGTGAAIKMVAGLVASLTKAVFGYNDSQIEIHDRLAKFGITVGNSTTDITDLIKASGYWYNRTEGFISSVEKFGSGLIALDVSTYDGANKLAKILNVGDLADSFIKMGYTLEGLSKIQTSYLKIQELSGLSLNKTAKVLRAESLAYADSLKTLSALTGESVDNLNEKMAAQTLDVKFQAKMFDLESKGKVKLANKLREVAAMAELMGPKFGIAARDILTNTFATTQEGEALMIASGGSSQRWAEETASETSSAVDSIKEFSGFFIGFKEGFGDQLALSDEFRERMMITNQSNQIATQLYKADSKEQLEKIKKYQKEKNSEKDSAKNMQLAQMRAEKAAGKLTEETLKMVSGPVNSVFTGFANLVKATALQAAHLGNFLFGKSTEAFENIITLLGEPDEIKGIEANLNANIRSLDLAIKQQQIAGEKTAETKNKFEAAKKKRAELIAKQESGGAVSLAEFQESELSMIEAEQIYKVYKEAEAKRYGKTSEELIEERKAKEVRLKRATESRTKRVTEDKTRQKELKQQEADDQKRVTAFTKTQLEKYIKFAGGLSGDYEHFLKLNPTFAEKVFKLGEKYFQISGGKQLTLTSAFRSQEEQDLLYDAWLAAGGSASNPSVETPYGRVKTPAKRSNHKIGRAVDFDEAQLDSIPVDVLKSLGLHRPHAKDKVHVESMPGAKKGGIFDGPLSGYPMLLHGTEGIAPLLSDTTLAVDLKTKDIGTNFSGILGSMPNIEQKIEEVAAAPNSNKKSQEFANVLLSKLDDMERKISESSSIFRDIKLYMST